MVIATQQQNMEVLSGKNPLEKKISSRIKRKKRIEEDSRSS